MTKRQFIPHLLVLALDLLFSIRGVLAAPPPLRFDHASSLRTPPSSSSSAAAGPCEVRWFEQKIDHFGPDSGGMKNATKTGPATFRQRYFWCDSHWSLDENTRERGPVFLYTGNEGNVELYVNATGLMFENAERFGALLVFVECRFYGESHPFERTDVTQKNSYEPWQLHYLSVNQILSDYRAVALAIRGSGGARNSAGGARNSAGGARNSAVIAFGGSLGGMYAAWLRATHPAAIDGAIAASAPILSFEHEHPKTDAGGFAAGVTHDATPIARTGAAPACEGNVRAAWRALLRLGGEGTDEAYGRLASLFRLCPREGGTSAVSSMDDVYALAYWAQEAFDYMAMGNFPYVSGYILNDEGSLPAFPITVACEAMANGTTAFRDDEEALLGALRESAAVYYNYTIGRRGPQPSCFDLHKPVNDASAEVGFLWGYQYCSEIFQVHSRDGERDMFWKQDWDAQATALGCENDPAYGGVVHDGRRIERCFGGGRPIHATNIVFSNGALDPWSRQGVLPLAGDDGTELLLRSGHGSGVASSTLGLGPGSLALLIDKAAHHLDLFFAHPEDPPSVVDAREMEMDKVAEWIAEKKLETAGRAIE